MVLLKVPLRSIQQNHTLLFLMCLISVPKKFTLLFQVHLSLATPLCTAGVGSAPFQDSKCLHICSFYYSFYLVNAEEVLSQ